MAHKGSLTQEAYERLRADLLACRLAPGERLRIKELCKQLSVSSGAVRESLSRLASEGLVVVEPQLGFRVASISALDLQDLSTVWIEIEALCLRDALEHGDLAWEASVVAAFHRMSRTQQDERSDPVRRHEAFVSAHADFHTQLVAACKSAWLLRLRGGLLAQAARYLALSVPLVHRRLDWNKEHRELMEAALARNVPQAVALMTKHFNLNSELIIQALYHPQYNTADAFNAAQVSP